MNTFLVMVLTNVLLVTALFAMTTAIRSRVRNPAVLHVLWVLVLLKLVTPPLWTPRWALLPATESPARIAFTSDATVPTLASKPQSVDEPTPDEHGYVEPESAKTASPRRDIASLEPGSGMSFSMAFVQLVAIAWGMGSMVWFTLMISRIRRFRRCLRFAEAAPAEVQQSAARLAEQLGVRRSPGVWLVPGRLSPMLWAGFGSPRIIVARDLYEQLDTRSREALLLHELAHYRRGDHWIRWIEVAATAVYWWNPIVWLLRREIRAAEEQACDTVVVSLRPSDRRTYAEMLVATLGFISRSGLPAVATGIGMNESIEQRLTAIMCSNGEACLSRLARVGLCMLALVVLPLSPSLVRGERPETNATAPLPRTAELPPNNLDAAAEPGNDLAEGWKIIVPIPAATGSTGATFRGAQVTAWVGKGWLNVRRETHAGDLEWQVVLARASDPTKPEIKPFGKLGGLDVRYQDYFIRERGPGKVCIFRESKSDRSPEWPVLEFKGERQWISQGTNLGQGARTGFRISAWKSDSWLWTESGPHPGSPDLWIRLQPSTRHMGDRSRAGAFSGGSGTETGFEQFYSESDSQDDGELFVATRTTFEAAEAGFVDRFMPRNLRIDNAPEITAAQWMGVRKPLLLDDGLRGNVVLINFWADWNPISVRELHRFEKLHNKYAEKGLIVIGIHAAQKFETALLQTLVREGITFPVMIDSGGENRECDIPGDTAKRFKVNALPNCFLIDKEGKVVRGYAMGPPTEGEIESLLK